MNKIWRLLRKTRRALNSWLRCYTALASSLLSEDEVVSLPESSVGGLASLAGSAAIGTIPLLASALRTVTSKRHSLLELDELACQLGNALSLG